MHQEVCIRPDRKAQGRFDRYLISIDVIPRLCVVEYINIYLFILILFFRSKEICANNAKNARGTFDDKEQRLKGTDAEAYKDVSVRDHKVKNKWKKTHSNMINAIKEAKKNRPPTAMANIDVHIVT